MSVIVFQKMFTPQILNFLNYRELDTTDSIKIHKSDTAIKSHKEPIPYSTVYYNLEVEENFRFHYFQE